MRIIFYGTGYDSLLVLEKLAEVHRIVGVVTQPPKPAGRGLKLKPSPVGVWAEKRGLSFWQPQRLRKEEVKMVDEF